MTDLPVGNIGDVDLDDDFDPEVEADREMGDEREKFEDNDNDMGF